MSALTLKRHELSRRAANLPTELAKWKEATLQVVDLNAHSSHLEAIELLVNTVVTPQGAAAKALDPQGDEAVFHRQSLKVAQEIARGEKVWGYFRDKLELRNSPLHKEQLWVADTIAWNCHRTTLNLAVQYGIVDKNLLREPPLIYCSTEYSPATWVREGRPNDGRDYALGGATLPIPVIEMPWDQLDNSWEYLSIHHEVGHDIEADLKLRPSLMAALQQELTAAGTFGPRIPVWQAWLGEVVADLCALRLAGPAFANALLQLLLLPKSAVVSFSINDPHPTPYIRILMNAEYIRSLGTMQAIQDHANELATEWRTLYGATSGTSALDAYANDFPAVFKALMKTPFPVLKGQTLEALLPFTEAEDTKIRSAVTYFRTGQNEPNKLPLRHVPAAARLAVAAENDAGTLTDDQCAIIHTRVLEYVRANAPSGLRGGGSLAHQQFIASFSDRMFK
jgi:hypothetical protein